MSIGVSEFDYLRRLLRERSAIVLGPDKEYLAESRLAPIVDEHGYGSVHELLSRLRVQPYAHLHRRVVDAMTNNETWFFRDLVPFEALRMNVIPQLISKRAKERRLSFWSAASSSGQEPYSMAMLIRENFGLPGWQFDIRATDISGAILDRALRARYSQLEVNRGVPATFLSKYFERAGLEWQLKAEVRNMVSFQQLNLADRWPELPPADVIFLRNVLIYFEVDIRKVILARIRRVLRQDGYLFLGGAETTLNIDDAFDRISFGKCSCYQLKNGFRGTYA